MEKSSWFPWRWRNKSLYQRLTWTHPWCPLPHGTSYLFWHGHCCCSVAQLCLTLCNSMDSSTAACLSFTVSRSLLKLTSIESVMPSNHLILCCLLLLLPSIFPSIRIFSNESALRIRWPKYWSFSFSISPPDEYSGLISFKIDWLDLLEVQDLSRVFSSTTEIFPNL